MPPTSRRRALAVALAAVVLLGAVPAVAVAETRSGGTVVVEEGETVDGDLTASGGTVVVRGTVNGNLQAFAGTVIVDGTVTGDVQAFAGTVRIAGEVGGDVQASGGSVTLAEGATVDGSLQAGAGSVVVAGSVGGNAELGGDTVVLRSTADVAGNVRYDGELTRESGAAVGGSVVEDPSVGGDGGGFEAAGWLFGVYGVLVNLALGAVLLLAFPGFSRGVAGRIADAPLRTGGVGLLALVGVPALLLGLLITVVGIPLALLGALGYAAALWVGYVYGAFAAGSWLLSVADVGGRWLALVVGVVAVALAGSVPLLGGLVEFAVLLLGLGALTSGLYGRVRGRRSEPAAAAEPVE
jgi:cytoskeletal protein CcmA (bactofilin family)